MLSVQSGSEAGRGQWKHSSSFNQATAPSFVRVFHDWQTVPDCSHHLKTE